MLSRNWKAEIGGAEELNLGWRVRRSRLAIYLESGEASDPTLYPGGNGRRLERAEPFPEVARCRAGGRRTLSEAGIVPRGAAEKLREKSKIDIARILEHEARVKHDVIAFTIAVSESVGDPEAARWLHYGLTSNDVVDTAQSLVVRDASRLILQGLSGISGVLERRAWEFKDTPEIGRTHGVHAEPITFGLKVANWFAEIRRDIERFPEAAAKQSKLGKFPARSAIARIWVRRSRRKFARAWVWRWRRWHPR